MKKYTVECRVSEDDGEICTNSSNEKLTERQKKIIGNHKLTPRSLETGFGIHSWSSLKAAINASKAPENICKCIECDPKSEEEMSTFRSESSQTTAVTTTASSSQQQLHYIMGLSTGEEEDEQKGNDEEVDKLQAETGDSGDISESMRQAQNYLREHRIFEVFQYLIANLLAEIPFDPIEFLINLLDRCMVYRSGIGDPPLLYNKKHINCLFNMMDRMHTGFISYDQYKTGMHTLGIKSYNRNPPLSLEGAVTKNYFVEEAYERLKDLLSDMLRKRSKIIKKKFRKTPKAPPPSTMD